MPQVLEWKKWRQKLNTHIEDNPLSYMADIKMPAININSIAENQTETGEMFHLCNKKHYDLKTIILTSLDDISSNQTTFLKNSI